MQEEKYWSRFATDFEERNNYVVGLEDMNIVKQQVAEQAKLGNTLELACGNGTYTKVLATNATSITATDLSDKMLETTKRNLQALDSVSFEQVDGTQLPYSDATFDTIFMANLLHITDNYDSIVKESYRVLKSGGRIIAIDFTKEGMSTLNQAKMITRYLATYGKPPQEGCPFSLTKMRDLLRRYNFTIEKLELIGIKSKAIFAIGRKI